MKLEMYHDSWCEWLTDRDADCLCDEDQLRINLTEEERLREAKAADLAEQRRLREHALRVATHGSLWQARLHDLRTEYKRLGISVYKDTK